MAGNIKTIMIAAKAFCVVVKSGDGAAHLIDDWEQVAFGVVKRGEI